MFLSRLFLIIFFSIILILCGIILIINVLQNKTVNILPNFLKTWNFLPIYFRSLEPYDKFMIKYILCCKIFKNDYSNNKSITSSLVKDTKGTIINADIEIFTISNLYKSDHFVKIR